MDELVDAFSTQLVLDETELEELFDNYRFLKSILASKNIPPDINTYLQLIDTKNRLYHTKLCFSKSCPREQNISILLNECVLIDYLIHPEYFINRSYDLRCHILTFLGYELDE